MKELISKKAKEMLGKPYKWGGNTPKDGFDCSGLVQYVYENSIGLKIGRNISDQFTKGNIISKNKLQDGDVVFFGKSEKPHHAGIYIGNNQYIHTSKLGDVVKMSNLNDRNDFITARRYF